jgi:hypothetical protein
VDEEGVVVCVECVLRVGIGAAAGCACGLDGDFLDDCRTAGVEWRIC